MEPTLLEFFKTLGEPKVGTKRLAPVLLDVEKAAGDSNRHKFTISTIDEDREGDILMPRGVILDDYLKNPVVLWAHDYHGLPIGRSLSVKPSAKAIVAEVEYAPTEFAQEVRLLVDTGFLKGSSVGFNPKTWEARNMAAVDPGGWSYPGYKFLEWHLLEWSVVPVPCNPGALVDEAKGKGMEVSHILKAMRTGQADPIKVAMTVPELLVFNFDESLVKVLEKVDDEDRRSMLAIACKAMFGTKVLGADELDVAVGAVDGAIKALEGAGYEIIKAGATLNAANRKRLAEAKAALIRADGYVQEVLDSAGFDPQEDNPPTDTPEADPDPKVAQPPVVKEVKETKDPTVIRVRDEVKAPTFKLPVDPKGLAEMLRSTVRDELRPLTGRLD